MTGPTALENRLERRVRDWRKQAAAYRLAQHDCEPSEDEWHLNKENADTLERCASELASDLSAGRVFRRSQYEPKYVATNKFAEPSPEQPELRGFAGGGPKTIPPR